jgi:uroporphyrin-III C-methyltransferase
VHDRLVSAAILAMVPLWAERIDVGKRLGAGVKQETINEILIDRGSRYECVVRLKGGDPHVFGRAAEELLALRDAGIAGEVVPGVSSAIAAPAAAGIPLTTRLASSGFTVITAHQDPANDRTLDWGALATLGTTLVILMGAARAGAIRDRLLAGGMPGSTPVAIVARATQPDQTETRTTLAELGNQPVESPATIVVGAVAALDLRSIVVPITTHEVVPR